jgi:broad specificity phosphatase PhoE
MSCPFPSYRIGTVDVDDRCNNTHCPAWEDCPGAEREEDGDETQARLRGLDSELADVKAQLADLTARFNRVIAGIVKGAEGVE